MPWVSRLLRGDRVYVRATTAGRLVAGPDGRVDVIYRKGGKVYRAGARNLDEDPSPEVLSDEDVQSGAVAAPAARSPRRSGHVAGKTDAAVDPLIVYADGACSGNPGPCGIGIVLLDGKEREEISEYLGTGTNNVAELTAIIRALERVRDRGRGERTVILHSDSAYALGLLGQNWKAKANQELVAEMRELARAFPDLRLVKVAGHAGIAENERADSLARDAVVRRR